MIELDAATIGELIEYLELVADEYGDDCQWNGWDDGSLIIDAKDTVVEIRNEAKCLGC